MIRNAADRLQRGLSELKQSEKTKSMLMFKLPGNERRGAADISGTKEEFVKTAMLVGRHHLTQIVAQ